MNGMLCYDVQRDRFILSHERSIIGQKNMGKKLSTFFRTCQGIFLVSIVFLRKLLPVGWGAFSKNKT